MTAPDDVKNLVERFENNREQYRSPKYNETQARQDFIDPFFKALGWDIYNEQGLAQDYRDVILEDSLEVEGATKAPDYAFRIGRERKFFVEAKKPAVNLETGIHAAFQVRRYAWSAKLPVSILTDFEELVVYDCRIRPDKTDKASVGRVGQYGYRDYVEKWDEIAGVFSKEAVLRGSFDKYAEGVKGKRGTAEVDDAFLTDIEGWRLLLAKNIALRNPRLSVRELNYAVQMTLDRIIFLRICEDRGIELYGQLQRAGGHEDIYPELRRLFQVADARYNSGLFHFKDEKGQSSEADALTLGLTIDDKALQGILKNLYAPDCPYVFSVIPTEILGQVYEQFLGKVIRLTAGHQAKVEEKPEVRKAGGVYYTPTYIVDYIVKNTLGKMLEGKTPADAARLKVLDPACGSGSFLLGAYQCLLDWHLRWYSEHEPQKWAAGKAPAIFESKDGWQLTTARKKEILLNNIHGVDIDAQAVEVTKLSLLLKVLEGESQETIGSQLSLLKERVLPDLAHNIKCGNSLIGPDYFEGRMMVDEEERRGVNAFDWKAEFPRVFVQGGFDVVLGNPPYVRMEGFKGLKQYLKRNYACHNERSDMYAYFIEKEHKLLNEGGRFGMIVSNKFLRANYGTPLREFMVRAASIERIVDLAGLPVFKGATVRTIIIVSCRRLRDGPIRYSPPLSTEIFKAVQAGSLSVEDATEDGAYNVPVSALSHNVWNFAAQGTADLLARVKLANMRLSEYCDGQICMGVKSGLTQAFVIDSTMRTKIIASSPKASEIIKPFLNGRDVRRYSLEPKDLYLIYTYHGVTISDYPAIERHLEQFKEQLRRRATRQEWYELQQPQYAYTQFFEGAKIVFPDIAASPRFALDDKAHYGSNTTYFIPRRDLYLLGLLNSQLGNFYFRIVCAGLEGTGDTYLRFFGQYLEGFPVRTLNFSDPADKARHDKMVSLVERMLALHKQSPNTPQEKEALKREIEATDSQIDRLVYELYGLTEEEIRIVEGGA